ncbi:hypothetical protein BDV97DRAFT_350288 [Delphinella strobiligena]|nr:hypothetical protein BDV97DRAFT_350288 [Delphinella strobiligena]
MPKPNQSLARPIKRLKTTEDIETTLEEEKRLQKTDNQTSFSKQKAKDQNAKPRLLGKRKRKDCDDQDSNPVSLLIPSGTLCLLHICLLHIGDTLVNCLLRSCLLRSFAGAEDWEGSVFTLDYGAFIGSMGEVGLWYCIVWYGIGRDE